MTYNIERQVAVIPITKDSATGTILNSPVPPTRKYTMGSRGAVTEVPAQAIIFAVHVCVTTAWNQAASLRIGKTGTAGWLVDTGEVDLTTAVPAGEAAAVTSFSTPHLITDSTPLIATWSQAAASAGAGYIVVEYGEF